MGWMQVLQSEIPQPTSFRRYRSRSTRVGVRKWSVSLDKASTLHNLAPGCLFEKLSLGHHSLPAGPLTNGDFDHRRSSCETRMRQVPNTRSPAIASGCNFTSGAEIFHRYGDEELTRRGCTYPRLHNMRTNIHRFSRGSSRPQLFSPQSDNRTFQASGLGKVTKYPTNLSPPGASLISKSGSCSGLRRKFSGIKGQTSAAKAVLNRICCASISVSRTVRSM